MKDILFMKMNLKNNLIARQLVRCTAAFACVFIALAVMSYKQSEQKTQLVLQNQQLLDKLRDTCEQNKLIQLLNNGHVDAAKQLINQQLAYNLQVIDTLAAPADANAQGFAKIVKTDIAKDERTHPEFYLASAKPAGFNGARVAQMARH